MELRDSERRTALLAAAQLNHLEVVKLLLNRGCKKDAVNQPRGRRASYKTTTTYISIYILYCII